MHIIFIRHGDPDYKNNTVTEKGKRESLLLAQRIKDWNVQDFYCSPYGRAQDTLKPALELTGRKAETLEWLREFDHHVVDPLTGTKKSVPWDWMPDYFYGEKKLHSVHDWYKVKPMKNGDIESYYRQVCNGFDSLMAESYDYVRRDFDTPVYNCMPHLSEEEAAIDVHTDAVQKNLDDRNIVFTCHLGVEFLLISHLTGISPVALWQGFFVAPTSVTVLGAEERIPGEVVFRVQMMGDVSHLKEAGELPSASGFFGGICGF